MDKKSSFKQAAPKVPKSGIAPANTTGPAECPKCHGYGFIIDEENAATRCDCGLYDERELTARLRRSGIPQRFLGKTLQNFKVPPGDRARKVILDSVKAYAQTFDPQEVGGLLLRGCPGSGKTHIAVAVLTEVIRRGMTGYYCNFTDLLTRIRATYRDNAQIHEEELLEPLDQHDLVVIDDVGAESATDWVRDRLYLIINRRYENGLPVIITTNCGETELENKIGPRTASRLYEMCEGHPLVFPNQDYRKAMMH